MTMRCTGRGAAGINRELLEKSGAAGWKLIGNPAKLALTNFCRLCDLRSREVCLYRCSKRFRGTDRCCTRWAPGGRQPLAVNRV